MTITMFDAVNAAAIPSDAHYAAYYTDGHYANFQAVRNRCPHATLLSITVAGGDAACCDSETGDLTVAQTEAWVAKRVAGGAHRPCVYANLDRWENLGLRSALSKYGDRIRRWVAAYDNRADIPAGFDAHQFSTGNVDTSVCLDNFFVAAPASHPTGTADFAGSFNTQTGGWTVRGTSGSFRGAPPKKWASVELQLNLATGQWRHKSLPVNAKPLGD